MGKAKGGANKLAKMSDEDRARYLQHRADMEEEARRRKQELINGYLKNKLKREDAFMRINLAKINQEWRQILRRAKCTELRSELEAMQKAMKEAVDRKDTQIQYLLNEIDECEDQYDRAYQAHLMYIDRFLRLYRDRLNDLNERYEHHKDEKVLTAVRDKIRIENTYEEQMKHLKVIIHQNDVNFDENVGELTERRLNSKLNTNSEVKVNNELYAKEKQTEIGQLWEKILQTLNVYIEKTNSKRKEYEVLREKDLKEQIIILQQNNVINQQKETIRLLQKQFNEEQEKSCTQITTLKEQREALIKNYKELKKNLLTSEDSNNIKLKNLTVLSNDVIDHLKNIYKKGENIINLITITKKYETEKEILEPWKGYNEFRIEDATKEDEIDYMDKFWWRYNSVSIQCNKLKNEKTILEKKNANLKTEFRDYMKNVLLDGSTRTMESSLLLIPEISVKSLKKTQACDTIAGLKIPI